MKGSWKSVAEIFLLQVALGSATLSPHRSRCLRIGNFSPPIKNYSLAGHVISSTQVPSRIDCGFNCLEEQRCVSYNYEEGEKVFHDCELNSESKETRSSDLTERTNYSYYGLRKSDSRACASSPCGHYGTCIDTCTEGSGFKCICTEERTGDKCQDNKTTVQDYEVVFPEESVTDFIMADITETLSQFTLCLWANIVSPGWSTFFSHVTSDGEEELMLRCQNVSLCQLGLIEQTKSFYVVPFNDSFWHHICVSWENGQGIWNVIIDGAVMAHGSAWHQTLNLRPGLLVVGQRQTSHGGGFTLDESFAGKVASVNVWDVKIALSFIKEMARTCSQVLGNVTNWAMFRNGFNGHVQVRSPHSCVSPLAENEFILDFPSRQTSDYVETTISQTLSQFTFSLWIKRGYDGDLDAGLFSYSTSQFVKALAIIIGGAGGSNLYVMTSNSYNYRLPPTTDDLWHHFCATWSNTEGYARVFFDGVLKSSRWGYRVNIVIPAGGILRIGQHQGTFGGDHNPVYSYHGKFARINMWSKVLDDSAIVALARGSGAENGDIISWTELRTMTHGNVAVHSSNLQLTAQESDYDLNFASKSTANYAVYSEMPSLTKLTACVWIRVTHQSVHYIFTYASSSSPDAIALGYYANYSSLTRLYFNINAWSFIHRDLSPGLHDGGWHHVCFTWSNSDGKLCPHVNGEVLTCFTDYKTGETIPGKGQFILGQGRDAHGGGFAAHQAFFGRMSRVNVWNYVVHSLMITEMYKGCGSWNGNAIAWFHFKDNITGDIEIIRPSSCSLVVPTVQAARDAYCGSRYSDPACGTAIRAAFDREFNQVGKRWRCYYDIALTTDSHTQLPIYDTDTNSECLHSIETDLLALAE